MNYSNEQRELIFEYSKCLKSGNASVFIGSGLSRASGYTGWSDLLKKYATKLGLQIKKEESDLISLAQYYVNSKNDSKELKKYICDVFAPNENKPISKNHILLSSLPLASYWTTNYDTLIEQSLEYRNIHFNKVVCDKDLRKNDNANPIWLYKMHGDVFARDSVVISKQDYENYSDLHEMLIAKLKSEICTKTFLFLGYSISDPNITHILARARKVFDKDKGRRHYAIMPKPKKILDNGKKNRQYNYEIKKQEHQIADFAEYGIKVVLIDDFSQITSILKAIVGRVYSKNVVISGAFENETSNSSNLCRLTQSLSTWLITRNYKIFTGYGKNIGQYVVNGAFDGCQLKFRDDIERGEIPDVVSINQRVVNNFNSRVFIFPFPYDKEADKVYREQKYMHLRENMIASTHITIVVCGEKYANGQDASGGLVNAEGVSQEIEISLSHGNYIIPLAFTGGVARIIWEKLKDNVNEFYHLEAYDKLNGFSTFDDLFKVLDELLLFIESKVG